ncbi:hypothetical protein [Oscillibacter sp.]|uniref:hypothetical protein n=1 Tax=Oscillibacter sp. TaxID=1945593 RepID=UPI00289E59B5|nr:hypothetical protein [Oscillibacter sp.]
MNVLRTKRRKVSSAVYVQGAKLDSIIGPLPGDESVYKLVSFSNLTAAGFLRYVADRAVIRRLDVSTFRIGPSALRQLRQLADSGRLLEARFVVGQIMRRDKRKASAVAYWDNLTALCRQYGWQAASRDNHTKLALFDTDCGKFVLEGSCNLNEAPNWEQFSFCRDHALYDFYRSVLDEMLSDRYAGEKQVQVTAEEQPESGGWIKMPSLF